MRIIHGPRPKSKILPAQLLEFESSGAWLAQRKFNGRKNTFCVSRNSVQFYNKGKEFSRYRLPAFLRDQILSLKFVQGLKPEELCWFDSELLEPRVPNTIVIYDVLQVRGNYLIGERQEDRLAALGLMLADSKGLQLCESGVAFQVTENVWLAQTFTSDFTDRFKEFLHLDLIEGLVLRRKDGRLRDYGHHAYVTDTQVRCRKPAKNYRF